MFFFGNMSGSDPLCITHVQCPQHPTIITNIIYYNCYISGSGKREAHKKWSMVIPGRAASTRHWNYCTLRTDYWPFAGGLSAVNAIGMQLRDLINLGQI